LKKALLGIGIVAALIFCLVMPTSLASANSVSESLTLPEIPAVQQESDSLKMALPEIKENMGLFENKVKAKQEKPNTGSVGTRGSAPPLTELEVVAVGSSQYQGYELIAENQVRTLEDHGGAVLYIVTGEIGYGANPIARINGDSLECIDYEFIDYNDDNIVDGFYYWWDASGYQNGTFTYQNTSDNYPYNTMSDWIDIQ